MGLALLWLGLSRPLQIRGHGPAFGGGPGAVVGHYAGGFPVAGQHDFRGGRAARRQFGREPDPATVRRHARLDAGKGWLAGAIYFASRYLDGPAITPRSCRVAIKWAWGRSPFTLLQAPQSS